MNKYSYDLTTNKDKSMKEKRLRRSRVQNSALRHFYYLLQTKTDVVATTQNILTTLFSFIVNYLSGNRSVVR